MRPNLLLPLSLLRRSEATYFSLSLLSFNAFSSPTKAPPTNERSTSDGGSEPIPRNCESFGFSLLAHSSA